LRRAAIWRKLADVPPATDWKERIDAGEPARLEQLAEALHGMQRRNAHNGHTDRALHAKTQVGLEATFTVLPDLPEHARAGLCAHPGEHRAYVRFSNGAGVRQSDTKPDVRGVAIKVLGVPGKKVIPALADATTQDFLLIRTPTVPFRDADEFVGFTVASASPPLLLLPRAIRAVGLGRTLQIIRSALPGLKAPMASFATATYFSALPIRWGAYAARYQLRPRADGGGNGDGAAAKPGKTADYLRDEIARRLAGAPVEYDFRVQFFTDEARTPIEDPTRDWSEADAPYVTVARLTLPAQDPASPRGRKVGDFVDRLSFDPWHALDEHRPLGNLMRARNVAYRVSTGERHAAPEPDGTERFDD
jgi:hypothetical protein